MNPPLVNNQVHSTLGDFLKHFIPLNIQKSLAINLSHFILVKMYSTETEILTRLVIVFRKGRVSVLFLQRKVLFIKSHSRIVAKSLMNHAIKPHVIIDFHH